MKFSKIKSTAITVALKTRLAAVLLLVLSTVTFTTPAVAAELVINGGFELPVVDPDLRWMTYYGQNKALSELPDCEFSPSPTETCNDDTRVPGWSVFWTDDLLHLEQLTPGRLEIQTGNVADTPAFDGSLQKAELDSHHRIDNNNNNVTIAQLLPTCPSTAYTLSYAWKSRTTITGDNDTRVAIDDHVVNIHQQNLDWESETVHFVSNDSSVGTVLLFGSIGTETTTGMFLDNVSVTGPAGGAPFDCTLVCGEKPKVLTLRYDGNDTSNNHQTSNEVIIMPEVVPSFPNNATIRVYGHKKRNPRFLGEFDVSIGGFFSVSGPRNRIPPRLTFEIYRAGTVGTPDEELFQTVTFHTSCSQPMDAGDEFGAITVWSATH